MDKNITLNITGMTCMNCKNSIERKLRKTDGISRAEVNYSTNTAEITYIGEKISPEQIITIIESLGYGISDNPARAHTLRTIMIIIALYAVLQFTGVLNILAPSRLAGGNMGYAVLFAVGLVTSVHCAAMCGGLSLSQSLSDTHSFVPSVLYNAGRVMLYTAAGFVLGLAGLLTGGTAGAEVSVILQAGLKVIAGAFMLIIGANMLNIFPSLRSLNIRLPKFISDRIMLARLGRTQPFIVGILNGFMPCGPLQSMWLVALASGSPVNGALSMLAFGAGTVPLMLGLGSAVSVLGRKFTDRVTASGAVVIAAMGLVMLSQGGALVGVMPHVSFSREEAGTLGGEQTVRSTLASGRYPDIRVKAGIPVKWVIDAQKGSINGCNYKFMIRDYNIEHTFRTGENVINFMPERAGTVYYSCWMGMITGSIEIYQ